MTPIALSKLNYYQFLIFADDIQLFLKVSSTVNCLHLQENINSMQAWILDV